MDLGKLLRNDGLKDVIDVVAKNRDLLTHLPALVASLSSGLSEAGGHARAAGRALVGDGADTGATARLSSSAKSVGSVADRLAEVATFVAAAADEVDQVPLMGGPAKKLVGAAGQIKDATSTLSGLSDDLVALADILGDVGDALSQLGDNLDTSGREAKRFVTV